MQVLDRRRLGMGAIVVVVVLAVVLVVATLPPPLKEEHFFSFESDMQGWATSGTDLEHDSTSLNWSVSRNESMARDGNTSLRLYLENLNDMGKIWIERLFNMKKDRAYKVTVEYTLASSDFGTVNNWRIITGVLGGRPMSANDLTSSYRESTSNGRDSSSGHMWLDKKYDLDAGAKSDGVLWVVIGVWGTWESARAYFIDSVRVTFIER